jgi:hypothetical protein
MMPELTWTAVLVVFVLVLVAGFAWTIGVWFATIVKGLFKREG